MLSRGCRPFKGQRTQFARVPFGHMHSRRCCAQICVAPRCLFGYSFAISELYCVSPITSAATVAISIVALCAKRRLYAGGLPTGVGCTGIPACSYTNRAAELAEENHDAR
jgi:hypothetical protein